MIPLETIASEGAVTMRLEVIANDDALYAFTLDNFRVYDAVEDYRSLLTTEARRPYTAFLNGEQVTQGSLFGVAERAWVEPRIGRNVLTVAADNAAGDERWAGSTGDRTPAHQERRGGLGGSPTVRHVAGILWTTQRRKPQSMTLRRCNPCSRRCSGSRAHCMASRGGAFGDGPQLMTAGGVQNRPHQGRRVLNSRAGGHAEQGSVFSPLSDWSGAICTS